MKLEILGPGCPKCKALVENAKKAVEEVGVDATIEKVTEVSDIMKRGVMMTPALCVNGRVKSAGKVATVSEIVTWITETSSKGR